MEIKEFIKQLLGFYTRLIDDFSEVIDNKSFKKYKKEYKILLGNYEKINSNSNELVKDVDLMLKNLGEIFSAGMDIEIIEEYLRDQGAFEEEHSPFNVLSYGDMVSSGIWSQVEDELFDSSGVRLQEISNPQEELNNPTRHEK